MGVRLNSTLMIISLLLVFSSLFVSGKQIPLSLGGEELSSPTDWIKEEQIQVYEKRVIIDLEGAKWATFTNTNSMDPVLDETAHALEIPPSENIEVGDIISYQTPYGIIVHRVVEKGIDEKGLYYLVKGDNNNLIDPFKVRFDDIVGVVVMIVY